MINAVGSNLPYKAYPSSNMATCVGGGNLSFTSKPDIFIKQQEDKKGLSTTAKIAIGAGVITAVAIGCDLIVAKGKHIKQLFGKFGNKSAIEGDVGTHMHFGEIRNPYNVHRYNLYNRTPEELAQECRRFKTETGAILHVPDTMASNLFGAPCSLLERAAKDGNFPKDIKHVLVGHGYGSSVRGDWSITGRGGNVYNYINNNPQIKPGEKVLVLCCENGEKIAGRRGVGGEVILSLTDSLHPAKIVIKGENKIAGDLHFPRLLSDDSTIPSIHMYSDRPLFNINRTV